MFRSNKLHFFGIFAALGLVLAGVSALCVLWRHGAAPHDVMAQTTLAIRQEAPSVAHVSEVVAHGPEITDAARLSVAAGYGKLPLSFEPNRGQSDPRVKFLSRAGNRTLWLTKDEAVLAVGRPSRSKASPTGGVARTGQVLPAVLRMKFAGANPDPAMQGEDRQPGTVNYFAGRPEQWRAKIPTYSRVRYRNLYPGIDLVFYGNNRELEYDLVVSQGADPAQIKLRISGAKNLRVDADGNLVLETRQGDVIQQKPKIYQRKGSAVLAIAGDYVITGKDAVGFRL
ncbi:MAG TPA: hypothetical protein VLT16_16885, partial [Candidatus Limnocylindrales bacterium]|nr:hypothetical protein [Candidatus Limnocylindrales bacterium]